MTRFVQASIVTIALAAAGCGDKPLPTVPNDPESVRKLEELQKRGSQGEK